jgi:AcrR family transcriptional regulator
VNSPAVARGEAVRARLLDAAAELVPERGWSAVSTRLLADRAGVSPSVVHYHFSSVQALLVEAVLRAMRSVVVTFDPVLESSATPAELVKVMLASVADYTGEDPLSLLFVEAYLATGRDEALRGGIGEILAEFRAKLGRWFGEHGVSDPAGTAAVLLAAVDGLLLHRVLKPDAMPATAASILCRLVGPSENEEASA